MIVQENDLKEGTLCAVYWDVVKRAGVQDENMVV